MEPFYLGLNLRLNLDLSLTFFANYQPAPREVKSRIAAFVRFGERLGAGPGSRKSPGRQLARLLSEQFSQLPSKFSGRLRSGLSDERFAGQSAEQPAEQPSP
jgi:hypothetical protein